MILSIYLSIRQSFCLFIYLFIYVFIYLFIYLFIVLQKNIRGVDCDTWVSHRTDYPAIMPQNSTWEWAFVSVSSLPYILVNYLP